MKIAFGGDVHGNVPQIERHLRTASRQNVTHYIQLGDWNLFQTPKFQKTIEKIAEELDIIVWWLDGNHDDFPYIKQINPDNKKEFIQITEHVFYMPRNLQFTLDDIKFHVIGGAHSIDEQFRTLGEDLYAEEDITQEDIEYAKTLPQADVLLSHDCPDTVANPITSNFETQMNARRIFGPNALDNCAIGQANLSKITNHINPTLIFHGHYHYNYRKMSVNPKTGDLFRTEGLDEGGNLDVYKSLFITDTQQLKELIDDISANSV